MQRRYAAALALTLFGLGASAPASSFDLPSSVAPVETYASGFHDLRGIAI